MVLGRLGREPYDTLLRRVQDQAAAPYRQDAPDTWTASVQGHNAVTCTANAFLAWLLDDEAAAEKARQGLAEINPDFADNDDWDVNIRMVRPLTGWVNGLDLLQATPFLSAEEAATARERITTVCAQFFDQYVEDDVTRGMVLGFTQNNHPIRTAVAIGYVALAFPDHPDAPEWRDWAFSELDYLWGPTGHYVQSDGGISEGPFYGEFAWSPSLLLFIAAHHAWRDPPLLHRDCRNRVEYDPWGDHACENGEAFHWKNPLEDPESRFHRAAAWEVALRLPWGSRPPLADAHINGFNGGALLTTFGHDGVARWDWERSRDVVLSTEWAASLSIEHLLYLDDAVPPEPPSYRSVVLPDAGDAVLRSGWSDDARWLLLVAEHGSARKTVHDHVDGLSFSLAAYGEYLLMDPGYYKPNPQQNARTSAAQAHSLILIDGEAAPPKGLLVNFGDADAFLQNNALDNGPVEYVEARQTVQETTIERAVAMVDGRYFLVADVLSTTHSGRREHRWRLHGAAGYDEGGVFQIHPTGARFERPLAGVDVFVASASGDASGPMRCEDPPFVPEEPPHVHQYDLLSTVGHHGVLDAVVHATAPGFLAVLAPYRTGATPGTEAGPLSVTDVSPPSTPTVRAWRIGLWDAVDIALLRVDGAPTTLPLQGGPIVETDARFALFRLSGPRAFALIARGTTLGADGDSLVQDAEGPVHIEWPEAAVTP